MRENETSYMRWLKEKLMNFREGDNFGLASSGLRNRFASLAEMDIDMNAMDFRAHNFYGYEKLISALSNQFQVPYENIYPCAGTSGANFLAFSAVCRRGDRVLLENPVYQPLKLALEHIGAEVVTLPRRRENHYQIDPDEFRELCVPGAKLTVITNLHNPSCVLIDNDDLRELGKIAAEAGGYILVDEVYLEFYYNHRPKTAFHLGDNFIVTSSITKAYGLGDLRGGWIFAPDDIIRKAQDLYDLMNVHNPLPAEYITCKFLEDEGKRMEIAQFAQKTITENFPIVRNFVEKNNKLRWTPPDNGICCFLSIDTPGSAEKLCDIMWNEHRTLLIPGRFFGDESGFRLGYGLGADKLKESLALIKKVITSL